MASADATADHRTEVMERAARAWLEGDPDPATRAELEELLRKGDRAELADRFGTCLEFGTAGLRGILGAGTNRMNRAVVRRTTLGLCRYLQAVAPEAAQRGIVVGRDGRHLSAEFLEDTAGVIAAAGIPALVFDGVVPTPLVSHAVSCLSAGAGVMITASHNPPAYNGYKVYWGNGAQIIPPHDKGIAAAIDAVGSAGEVPLLTRGAAGELWKTLTEMAVEEYLAAIQANQLHPEVPREVSIAYTPMHGVGNRFARAAFARCGFARVETVAEQAEPDGAFPTVAFPNPEEPGAMDRVVALATSMRADLALANDPDADRLAVAVRAADGSYVQLSGNEVGLLLGHYVLTERPRASAAANSKTLVVSTLVSSSQLGSVAAQLGVRYEETLTGFKWIANRALEVERAEGVTFAFGFEEALGYTVGTVARDKDGIGAAVAVGELAAVCKSRGRTLLDELTLIQRKFGLFVGSQKNLTLPGSSGAAKIQAIMASVRAAPPRAVGGVRVLEVRDIREGVCIADGERSPLQPPLPSSDVLVLKLEGQGRIILRPSGTEPKIKFYFELQERVPEGGDLQEARRTAQERLAALQSAFLALLP